MSIEHPVVGVALVKIMHMMYEHDILSEDVILHWHKHVTATDDVPERNKIRRQVRARIFLLSAYWNELTYKLHFLYGGTF